VAAQDASLEWKDVQRRFRTPTGQWTPITVDGIGLFNLTAAPVGHGNARKDCAAPISAHTVTALTTWLHEYDCGPTDPVFPTRRGRPLSTDAVAWLLTKHAATAARRRPSLNDKHLTSHVLRHTAVICTGNRSVSYVSSAA
jgi:integrase